MKNFFKKVGNKLQEVAEVIGGIIATLFMFVFYYTVFALFALPYRLFFSEFDSKSENSNWIMSEKSLSDLEYFKSE